MVTRAILYKVIQATGEVGLTLKVMDFQVQFRFKFILASLHP